MLHLLCGKSGCDSGPMVKKCLKNSMFMAMKDMLHRTIPKNGALNEVQVP